MTDGPPSPPTDTFRSEAEITAATERFFTDIIGGLNDPVITQQLTMMNRVMRQVRPYEAALIPDRAEELAALADSWAERDIPRMERLVRAYFARRQALVPQLVELINRPN